MKKLLILFLLLFPSLTQAYTSSDVSLPMTYNHHVFSDGHPWTGWWASDIHLVPDMSDYCVSVFRMQPSYTTIENAASSTFSYSGGYLLFDQDGDLIPIATTTLNGKSHWTPFGQGTYNVPAHEHGYCVSSANFDFYVGILTPSDPPVKLYYGWDTPDNVCRLNDYNYTECRQAGAFVGNGLYGWYTHRGFRDPLPYRGMAAVFTAFNGGPPARGWSVASADFQIGISNDSVGSWMARQLRLVIGSGLGILGIILPFTLAVIFIVCVVYFIYRAVTFMRH